MDSLKTAARRGRPRIAVEVERFIVGLLEEGHSPTQVQRAIAVAGGKAPSISSIIRIRKRKLPDDSSAPWTLDKALSPYEISLLPPVLALLLERTSGRRCYLSVLEARWITKVRLAAPDMPLWDTYRLARLYMVRIQREEPTADLDELLAFAPWRGQEQFERFFHMIKSIHPDWIQTTGHEPADDASPEEMRAALGSLRIAEGLWLAMEMQKGIDNEQAR